MIRTNGIVLGLSKHSDQAMHLHVYTQECGYLNIFVYGAGGKRKSLGLYQPLNQLALIIEEPQHAPMRLKEATLITTHTYRPMQQIAAITICEIVARSMHQPTADEQAYRLLVHTAERIENAEEQEIVPRFLVELSKILGYGGQMLDEWRDIKSLAVYNELI